MSKLREQKYKLTISILASNRKDTLPKTLESIRPILNMVSSELIITDTGCDDELLGVIKKYTDKIVKFTWCNDFAKARNVGLNMAKGQWFLFIDDDEWFEDVSEIVDFFNSGECENYNTLHYLVRNYGNMEGNVWQDTVVERCIKLDGDVEFVDCIHEHFSKVNLPVKLVNSYAHHYGYAYKTDEDRRKHFERNYPLLIKQWENDKAEVRHYIHIISACNNVRDYEKSLQWSFEGLKVKGASKEIVSMFYANIIHCEFFLDKLEDVIKHGERYIDIHSEEYKDVTELARCTIYSYLANAYLILRQDKKAIESLKEYFELYQYLDERYELKMSQSVGVTAKAYSTQVLNRMWYFGMMKATDMSDEEMVLYLMDKLKYLNHVEPLSDSGWEQNLLDMMRKSEHKECYVETLKVLLGKLEEELMSENKIQNDKCMLTISILASNRKDTLPKTLSSIKPILDNVASELIVTDTGCDEELLGIIRKYTQKIVKFTWCNDFSKARNVGLKMAKGQWFMFIDDDEWFEDVTDIIDFFNSGECDRYNSFHYAVRNYTNYEGTSWNDTYADRGVRIEENTQFEDAIHEHYNIIRTPIKLIKSYAHHYGYVYKSEEEKIKHGERNLLLLEKQIVEDNYNERTCFHLIQEYCASGYYEKAYELAVKLEQSEWMDNDDDRRKKSAIRVTIIYLLFRTDKNEELISKAQEYIRAGLLNLTGYCAVYAYMVYAFEALGDKENVVESVLEYFGMRKYLDMDIKLRDYFSLLATSLVYEGKIPDAVFNMGLIRAIELDNEMAVIEIMNNVSYVDKLSLPNKDLLSNLTKMLSKSERKAEFGAAMSTYIGRLQAGSN